MTSTPVNTQQQPDAYDDAMNPQPVSLERTYFGEVTNVDVWTCVLEKGTGKRKFDPGRDNPDQKRTAIKLQIAVEKKDGGSYTVDQDVINTAPEWQRYTLPSLRKLALDLRTLKGRWVKITRKPTGETYTNKSQEVKDRTAIVFEELYADRDACKAAADAFYASRSQSSNGNGQSNIEQPAPPQAGAPSAAPASGNTQERQFALDSLKILWQASGENQPAFLAMIAANPMISKYFSADSPEVRDITLPF